MPFDAISVQNICTVAIRRLGEVGQRTFLDPCRLARQVKEFVG
jgi:hypothetical protein